MTLIHKQFTCIVSDFSGIHQRLNLREMNAQSTQDRFRDLNEKLEFNPTQIHRLQGCKILFIVWGSKSCEHNENWTQIPVCGGGSKILCGVVSGALISSRGYSNQTTITLQVEKIGEFHSFFCSRVSRQQSPKWNSFINPSVHLQDNAASWYHDSLTTASHDQVFLEIC